MSEVAVAKLPTLPANTICPVLLKHTDQHQEGLGSLMASPCLQVAAEVISFAPMLLSDAGPALRPDTLLPSHASNGSTAADGVGWLLTRAQWVGSVYWLAAVSDGAGGGAVTFDFNTQTFTCTAGLLRVTPLASSGASVKIMGCGFTDSVPILGLRLYNVSGLAKTLDQGIWEAR